MNYSELQSLVAEYIDQNPSDTRATTFIKMCEAAVNKRLRTEGTESFDQIAGTGASTYDLPEHVGSLRLVASNGIPLGYMTPSQLLLETYNGASLCYYTRSAFTIKLNAALASPAVIDLTYHLMVPNLSNTATENWLLTDWEDIYVNGSIYEACMFHKDYEASSLWKTRFEESLETLITADVCDRWSGSPNQIRGA